MDDRIAFEKTVFLKKYFPTLYIQDPKIVQHLLTALTGVNSRGPQRLPNSLMPRVTKV